MNIPNSVTTIDFDAFIGCTGLASLTVDSENPMYDSRDHCNAIIETESNTLSLGCQNTIIPNTVNSIGYYAFKGCTGLTSIMIPNSVSIIGWSAFEGCTSLTSVSIPNSVTKINSYAFRNCSALEDVYSYITDLNNVTNVYGSFGVGYNYHDYSGRTLHVPRGTAQAYQANNSWAHFFGTIVEMVIPGDINGNGVANVADLTDLISMILNQIANIEDHPDADVNGDGVINISDVTDLIYLLLTK